VARGDLERGLADGNEQVELLVSVAPAQELDMGLTVTRRRESRDVEPLAIDLDQSVRAGTERGSQALFEDDIAGQLAALAQKEQDPTERRTSSEPTSPDTRADSV